MLSEFEAIFENGVLRPLAPIPLAEREHVRVLVSRTLADDWVDTEFIESCAIGADASVTLAQVRAALAKIPGSMDSAIDEARGER